MANRRKYKLCCDREDCALFTNELANKCEALEHVGVDTYVCAFYKTKEQMAKQEAAKLKRMAADPRYREICEYYGAKARGNKYERCYNKKEWRDENSNV